MAEDEQEAGPPDGSAPLAGIRRALVAFGSDLLERGLLSQTSGNLSVRTDSGSLCITPSSLEYDRMTSDDIVVCDRSGAVLAGHRVPSSETPLHCAVYDARPDVSAIVHTHSPYATTLAVLGYPIPSVHYMIASLGVTRIEIAPYATYGTPELAASVRDTFTAPARAILIANHGVVAAGTTLKQAADAAEAVEILAGLYYRAIAVGVPNVLTEAQMAEVMAKYRHKPQEEARRWTPGSLSPWISAVPGSRQAPMTPAGERTSPR
jgi:L-fuculose-phosphate aldolase